MTTERTDESTTTLATVEFIDSWLNENAMWVDSRVMDFALDVRTLLSTDSHVVIEELEPVGADA
ncbi:MAG: hypothetical protein ABFR89_02165 [Actinomycetota bacterium]